MYDLLKAPYGSWYAMHDVRHVPLTYALMALVHTMAQCVQREMNVAVISEQNRKISLYDQRAHVRHAVSPHEP